MSLCTLTQAQLDELVLLTFTVGRRLGHQEAIISSIQAPGIGDYGDTSAIHVQLQTLPEERDTIRETLRGRKHLHEPFLLVDKVRFDGLIVSMARKGAQVW